MMTVSVLDLIPFYVKDSKSYNSVHPLKSLEWNTMDNWRDLWVCLSASEEFVTRPYFQQWLISKWYTIRFFPPSSYFFANKFKSMHSHIIVFFSIYTLLCKSVNYNYFGSYERKLLILNHEIQFKLLILRCQIYLMYKQFFCCKAAWRILDFKGATILWGLLFFCSTRH